MTLTRPSDSDTVTPETDIVVWVNSALSGTDDDDETSIALTALDEKITQLLAALDIAYEDTAAQLERVIEEVSRSVPRVTYDLHFMKDSALSLQTSVTKALRQTENAVPDTADEALAHLRQLDLVKSRMEAAREALREAESWGALESEVTLLLAEHNYAKAAERLSEASRNMVVFQNTPEYDSRRTLMVNLQNLLEASLSSALVAAINVQDVASCQKYFEIFSQIQRESEFRNYYNASRRILVTDLWRDASLSDCDISVDTSKSPKHNFVDFLSVFYSKFLSLLQEEVSTISSIFPDPAVTLSAFISSTLSALQPSFSQRLSSLSHHHGEVALLHLIGALKVTEQFAENVENLFTKISRPAHHDQGLGASPKSKPLSRRRSTRMSISWHGAAPGLPSTPAQPQLPEVMEWRQEIFRPYLDLQINYGSLESNVLEHDLCQILTGAATNKAHEPDRARLLKERAIAVVNAAEKSLSRCDAFTYGYGAVGLVQSLDNFFKSFIDIWTADVRAETRDVDPKFQKTPTGEDLSDMDYTAQDWSDFQLLHHLLSSARVVSERMSMFETKLRSNIAQNALRFRLGRIEPSTSSTLHRGGSQLLEQSPLNSAELHALFDTVDGETGSRDSSLPSSRHSHLLLAHESSEPLLIEARRAVFTFADSCQTSLQRTLLSPLLQNLASYASSPIWSASEDPKSKHKLTASDLQVPTFSLSPTESMQRVAEGLLNLPRLFEVYADDDSLAFSLHTLPNIDRELFKTLEILEVSPLQSAHKRRQSHSAVSKSGVVNPEVVSSAWLSSLGRTLLLHLTADILPSILFLSVSGTAQLTADLEYLDNIIQALNVDFPELKRWKEIINLADEEGKKRLAEGGTDQILQVVARWRGWKGR